MSGYHCSRLPPKTYELGYWLSPDFWAKGIMGSAIAAFIAHLRRNFYPDQIDAVIAKVAEDNLGSSRALLSGSTYV